MSKVLLSVSFSQLQARMLQATTDILKTGLNFS